MTENVETIMSKVIRLCDHGRMVKLLVGFLAFKYYGSNFNTNETLTQFLKLKR